MQEPDVNCLTVDDSAENDVWVPFGASQEDGPTGWKYPPATAHSASCFMNMCQLSVIFNEILIHMYDPLLQNTEAEVQECLFTQEPALHQWWEQLPPFLKLDPGALPALAPPSHIVTMKYVPSLERYAYIFWLTRQQLSVSYV